MATAVWTGSLSLGLVVVPVRLFPAIHKKTVRFHELDRAGRRVRHVRVAGPDLAPEPYGRDAVDLQRAPRFDTAAPPTRFFEAPPTAPEVAYQEVRKGYEVAPGEYVSMSREEVAELAPERSRVIDVQQFVDVAAVDPIYFESRYYVGPDREWSAPFPVLRQALARADQMAALEAGVKAAKAARADQDRPAKALRRRSRGA